ncbi:MAG: VacJ family lipoprotein [Pseudomonadota bacterium]
MKSATAKTAYRLLLSVVMVLLISACATTAPPPEERHAADPWEPFNRNMYSFNRTVDKAILRPIARGYTAITPDPVERGISNIFDNIQSMPVILNLLLQGEPADAGRMFERFFVNTVFGLAGIFDVATEAGLPDYDEDFGQTLAVWGWQDSRYLVLPLLGPSTVRDALGRPVDGVADLPWNEVTDGRAYLWGVNLIETRARLLPREAQLEEAFDEYLFIRDAWLQRRDFQITGESETPDYEAFLEEAP